MAKYGFDYNAPLRQRLRLGKRILRGESVAYHIGIVGGAFYLPGPGEVVGCEVSPDGRFSTGVAGGEGSQNITVGSWEELQAAAAIAERGDTIWMLDGTYAASGSLFIGPGVSLRFIGDEDEGVGIS